MLFILMALLCCGEYKGVGQGSGQQAGEEGAEPGKGFFCRTVQWGIDRGDW
jgi:hypothetical protein